MGIIIDPVKKAAKDSVKYRQLRAADYIKELSPEGNFQTTVGDLIDALIQSVTEGNDTKLLELKTKIDAIKARHPK
jgi:hypothetical protein